MELKTAAADKRKSMRELWAQDVKARLGEPVDTRFFVEEYTEAYNTGGYYDQDIPEEIVDRSEYFKTEAEALAHLELVEPAKGNKLRIRKQTLWERHIPAKVERRWL